MGQCPFWNTIKKIKKWCWLLLTVPTNLNSARKNIWTPLMVHLIELVPRTKLVYSQQPTCTCLPHYQVLVRQSKFYSTLLLDWNGGPFQRDMDSAERDKWVFYYSLAPRVQINVSPHEALNSLIISSSSVWPYAWETELKLIICKWRIGTKALPREGEKVFLPGWPPRCRRQWLLSSRACVFPAVELWERKTFRK